MSKKVVVYIIANTKYPFFYSISEKRSWTRPVKFTEKQYQFIQKVEKDFDKIQRILKKAYNKGV